MSKNHDNTIAAPLGKAGLHGRRIPNLKRTIEMSLVRLNIDLLAYINSKDALSIMDLQRLADVIKSVITLAKIVPSTMTKYQRKSNKPTPTTDDLLE
jgi:hypothetical protein